MNENVNGWIDREKEREVGKKEGQQKGRREGPERERKGRGRGIMKEK